MKKILFFFACLTIGVLGAQVNAQTISSAHVAVKRCFNTESVQPTTVVKDCGTEYTWVCTQDPTKTMVITEACSAKRFERTLENYRGCDSTDVLILTLPGTSCAPTGAIDGEFSVSATKKVYFSKGNLQFRPSNTGNSSTNTLKHKVNGAEVGSCDNYVTELPGEFRFAEHQYEILTTQNKFDSENSTVWNDLFGGGTSGTIWGGNCTYEWARCQPYTKTGRGGVDFSIWPQQDWGWYNAISNGGNDVKLWRTLTREEWFYLLSLNVPNYGNYSNATRAGRNGYATVNGVAGYVVVPDEWDLVSKPLKSSYTAAEWEGDNGMQQSGAVFLPFAGLGDWEAGDRGLYWTATAGRNPNDSGAGYYFIKFFSNDISLEVRNSNARSVRLVTDVK